MVRALLEHKASGVKTECGASPPRERERLFVDNLLVRIHSTIEMIWWTILAPREFESPLAGSLISTFLVPRERQTTLASSRGGVAPHSVLTSVDAQRT